jgi:pyrimidine operon attenuation protein/uracil phosphoribosyltransferase
MQSRVIINSKAFGLTIDRLCYQLIENHGTFENTLLIGLQPRGIYLSERIRQRLSEILPKKVGLQHGKLDITFYRDDFRRGERTLEASRTKMDFLVEDKKVVLIDDVLFTGRTVRAGLDALLDFGRPEKVELLCFIDRRFSRHLPIQPEYVGKRVDSISSERVKVHWKELEGKDEVLLYKMEEDDE